MSRKLKIAGIALGCLSVLALLVVGGAVIEGKNGIAKAIKGPLDARNKKNWRAFKARNNKAWAERLLKGGYIIHIRHAQREKWRDSSAFDALELAKGIDASQSSFSRATCLTEQGVEEAKMMGEVFSMVGFKAAGVYSSPSCRAWQTAQYAFGRFEKVNALLARTAMIPAQHDDFNKRLRKLLLEVEIPAGKNVVLTGHGQTFGKGKVKVFDQNNMRGGEPRFETGFYVLERKDGKIIAQYRFASFKEFATQLIELPLE